MYRVLVVVLGLLLSSCTTPQTAAQQTANEGLVLMKRVNFESPPEVKLQTAQDLLAHTARYDPLIQPSTPTDSKIEAQRFKRSEREAAATLMRDAAADYTRQQQVSKARDVYRSILTTFSDEAETRIRQSAETEMNRLDEMQK